MFSRKLAIPLLFSWLSTAMLYGMPSPEPPDDIDCPIGTSLCPINTNSGHWGCFDLNTSSQHCGDCESPCPNGQTCKAATCVNIAQSSQVLTFSANPALAISDFSNVTSTIHVPNIMVITSVSVRLDIPHTFPWDLEVALIGPDNTTVVLHDRTDGSDDNNINTTYNITTRSAGALSAFNGKITLGAWKLRVRDMAYADTGTLSSWKVTFNGYYTKAAKTAIPDNNGTGITSTINVPATGTIVSLRVRVEITHTFRGDLEVALISPDNTTTVLLHDRTGSFADHLKTVYPDLSAPAQALAAFNGKPINGAWKLRVRDLEAADSGTLDFWEIDFRTK